MCSEWEDYIQFANWARANGYDENLTLERIDNDGDYCPENCTWVSRKEQANNRRSSRYITFNGETKTLAQWGETVGIQSGTIAYRIKSGWSIEDALTKPVRRWEEAKT